MIEVFKPITYLMKTKSETQVKLSQNLTDVCSSDSINLRIILQPVKPTASHHVLTAKSEMFSKL